MKKLTNQEIQKILSSISREIKFVEEHHIYTLNGKRLESVSGFIAPWNKEFTNKLDPNHPEYNKHLAINMPSYQQRGTMVHKLSELVDKNINDPWPYELRSYEAYYKLFNKQYIKSGKWEIIAIEAIVFSKKYWICGTIDRLFRNKETNEVMLLDIKTGSTQNINVYQQAMYHHMLEEFGIKVDKCYLLSLKNGLHLKELSMNEIREKQKEIEKYKIDWKE